MGHLHHCPPSGTEVIEEEGAEDSKIKTGQSYIGAYSDGDSEAMGAMHLRLT